VTKDTTRKSFLARVLGLAAVGALAPRTVARAVIAEPVRPKAAKKAAFRIQPQERAVARRDGSA
jgi:hypothetical protein